MKKSVLTLALLILSSAESKAQTLSRSDPARPPFGSAQDLREVALHLDSISFGDPASEKAHGLTARRSEVIHGGLGQPARRLLPLFPAEWQGGSVAFTLAVNPDRPNYVTVRLWGSDVTADCLTLFCEGKQIGYRHLGDVEILDIGGEGPGYNGRFYYSTSPLPLTLTKGKTLQRSDVALREYF